MTAVASGDWFVHLKRLAIVGVSRNSKFGNTIFKELATKGYDVVPVNPNMDTFENQRCYPSLKDIDEPVEGAVIVVSKDKVLDVLKDAVESNIKNIWVQQGAGSEDVKRFCSENRLNAVLGQCILMYAKPVGGIHAVHRLIWRILGLTS